MLVTVGMYVRRVRSRQYIESMGGSVTRVRVARQIVKADHAVPEFRGELNSQAGLLSGKAPEKPYAGGGPVVHAMHFRT